MDGLLVVIAIIVWVFSKSKKNKKSSKSAQKVKAERNTARVNPAQHRSERLAKLHAELEKKKAEMQSQSRATEAIQPIIGEGESLFNNTAFDQADTQEGECICDPELEHERETRRDPQSVYHSEIGKEPVIDFSARGILQGVVMSEILARPSQRTLRR